MVSIQSQIYENLNSKSEPEESIHSLRMLNDTVGNGLPLDRFLDNSHIPHFPNADMPYI